MRRPSIGPSPKTLPAAILEDSEGGEDPDTCAPLHSTPPRRGAGAQSAGSSRHLAQPPDTSNWLWTLLSAISFLRALPTVPERGRAWASLGERRERGRASVTSRTSEGMAAATVSHVTSSSVAIGGLNAPKMKCSFTKTRWTPTWASARILQSCVFQVLTGALPNHRTHLPHAGRELELTAWPSAPFDET